MLPFARFHLEELQGLVGAAEDVEQAGGVLVRGARDLAEENGGVAGGRESAARVGQFGLPVVQGVADGIDTPAELVRAVDLGEVHGVGVAAIRVEVGVRRGAVAPGGEAVVDARLTGVADVVGEGLAAVGAGDAPDFRAPVLAVVGTGGFIAEAGVAEDAINEDGGAEGVVEAERRDVDAGEGGADLAEAGTGERAESAGALDGGLHERVLAPHHELLGHVVVRLDVVLVARERERGRGEVVAGEAGGVLRGLVRQGGHLLDLQPGGGEERRGDLVVWERRAVGAIEVAGVRIVDGAEVGVSVEVAGTHVSGRH